MHHTLLDRTLLEHERFCCHAAAKAWPEKIPSTKAQE